MSSGGAGGNGNRDNPWTGKGPHQGGWVGNPYDPGNRDSGYAMWSSRPITRRTSLTAVNEAAQGHGQGHNRSYRSINQALVQRDQRPLELQGGQPSLEQWDGRQIWNRHQQQQQQQNQRQDQTQNPQNNSDNNRDNNNGNGAGSGSGNSNGNGNNDGQRRG